MKYKVNINDTLAHEISFTENGILIDGKSMRADVAFISGKKYHALSGSRSFMLEVLETDIPNKMFTIKVDDNIYHLRLEDQLDLLLEKMGMSTEDKSKADDIMAPMPGLVLKILVEPGQSVVKGDSMIILEAMKMENVIKANSPGIVKAIHVQQKDAVEKNHLLIEMN